MIEVRELSKRYGAKVAVDDVSFTVRPGTVTGFLGPNGAGKSTTMRLILGLDRPTSGTALINGKPLSQHDRPMAQVGALLEARAINPGRSARNHLLAVAATAGIGPARVDEVLELVGLTAVATRRVGGFSLGMGQRLGIATALLGDPETLILDEPVNGLDPDGVRWVRTLLRGLADQGRTVFLSSHLMSEMAQTADHVVVIGRGKVLRDMPMQTLIEQTTHPTVRVRSPRAAALGEIARRAGYTIRAGDEQSLEIEGATTDDIGLLAAADSITLLELSRVEGSLEEAYMTLTEGSLEYGERTGPQAASSSPGRAA